MKKVLSLFGFLAYLIGSIGGFGYALYCKQWVVAICIVELAVMAFPTFKNIWKELNS